MNIARRRQFWTAVHRYLGLATLGFLLVAALTGCLLCVDDSIDAALNPDLFTVPAKAPLPALEAVGRLEVARPDLLVTGFPLRTRPGRTMKLAVMSRDPGRPAGFDQLFLDPHDGRVVGVRRSGPGLGRRHIVDAVFLLHYTLLAGRWGRWLMGIAALGWLIGNIVGVYLTFPVGRPFWRKWRRAWQIDRRARLRWFMLDLHRASGLWLSVGLTILAFTSVAMNFFDEAVVPLTTAISPAKPSPFDGPSPPASPRQRADGIGFGKALAAAMTEARRRGLDWLPAVETRAPDRALYGVVFTASGEEDYRGLGPITYYIDQGDGRLRYIDDPYRDSGGRRFSRALYPLHSGEMIGRIGTLAIFLLGLATVEMCVTGIYTWWKKRRSKRRVLAGHI